MSACSRYRDDLLSAPARAEASHIEGCPDCARFTARLGLARTALREHHAEVVPDAGFAARVTARIERPEEQVAWVAFRLLPVAVALVAILAVLVASSTPRATTVSEFVASESADDPVAWLAVLPGGER